ncbi:MAG: type IV pilin [Halobacteria archaeon]
MDDIKTDRAVSSVIGSIILVAIAVLIATTISIYVFDLSEDKLKPNPQAAVSFSQDNKSHVEVTLSNVDRADKVIIKVPASSDSPKTFESNLNEKIGSSKSFTNLDPGDRVTVVGEYQGKNTTLTHYTVHNPSTE